MNILIELLIFPFPPFLSEAYKKLCQLCLYLGGGLFLIACFNISVLQYSLPRLILLSILIHYIALPHYTSLAGIMALFKLIMITML